MKFYLIVAVKVTTEPLIYPNDVIGAVLCSANIAVDSPGI